MDFIIPIKKMGIFTRSVLEGITNFYHPPRIFIITGKEEIIIMEKEIKKENWLVSKKIIFIEEETYFVENYGLTKESMEKVFEKERKIPYEMHREFGWWYQQLLKLGIYSQIPLVSQKYVVWDGDLIPLEKWELFNSFNQQYYVAILQEQYKCEFNKQQYDYYVEFLLGLSSKSPLPIGTFVTHHMVFDKDYVKEMMEYILNRKQISNIIPWPIYFLSLCSDFYRFSEYILYSSFMNEFHTKEFYYYPYSEFGKQGIRYRDPTEIIKNIQNSLPNSFYKRYFSYQDIKDYFSLSHPNPKLSYVQMEHVYKLL
jgi:hypothetical protein